MRCKGLRAAGICIMAYGLVSLFSLFVSNPNILETRSITIQEQVDIIYEIKLSTGERAYVELADVTDLQDFSFQDLLILYEENKNTDLTRSFSRNHI